ncbi:MAG: universal stress protein [Sulfolobaceae archaeon]
MKIVLAYDGSPSSKKALEFLKNIIRKGDKIYILTIVKEIQRSPDHVIIESERKAKEIQREAMQLLEGFDCYGIILESNDVASAIVEFCEKENCNLIVTGSRGLSALKKVILGSVSSEILSKSKVPVLIVK